MFIINVSPRQENKFQAENSIFENLKNYLNVINYCEKILQTHID